MSNPGTLYIVATPIGNLGDITLRALETLKGVDRVLCEDTRVTRKLLNHYQIEKPTLSFHEHTDAKKRAEIIERLAGGESLALVTDAGTPGVSDPGNQLVESALAQDIKVVPIPGVSALATLLSVAGSDMREFVFLGFPPHKKGRETFFKKIVASETPALYYESPHRVVKNLELLRDFGGGERRVIVGRELTKMYEQILRGTVAEALAYLQENPDKVRGEFTIIIS